MKKFIKLITAICLTSITGLQVTACTDNSEYNTFMSGVNNSINNNSAIFGFLGSKNDTESSSLQAAFQIINNNQSDYWQSNYPNLLKILNQNHISSLQLKYYLGPYSQDKPSDPVSSFWNDKSISWQRNIFNWITTNIKANNIGTPAAANGVTVNAVDLKADSSGNIEFKKLPIIFIIVKGKLVAAGQEWTLTSGSKNPISNIPSILDFILKNTGLIN